MKRKICVVTGTRAEYGLLNPVMTAIKNSPNLSLSIVATGMHLSPQFGYTVRDIERDGFNIDARADMLLEGDTGSAMAKSVGAGIMSMTQAFDIIKPDIVLILGDRIEPLAAAIASAYMGIPVAHMHGGDSARAGLDEYARHAITKMSNIHLPATEKSAERIIKMGEDPWRVKVVGAPGLDSILKAKYPSRQDLFRRLDLDPDRKVFLVAQHPVSTEPEKSGEQMEETMEALVGMGEQSILIYPNSDAGGRDIIKVIEGCKKYPFIHIFKNLPHQDYIALMKYSNVFIGNSSSGIIEAPSLGLPYVNIGNRQEGREKGVNVIEVPHDRALIRKAVEKAQSPAFREKAASCVNPYGDGKTGTRVAKILEGVKINDVLLKKKLTY